MRPGVRSAGACVIAALRVDVPALGLLLALGCSAVGTPSPSLDRSSRAPKAESPLVDSFEDISRWEPVVSTGVQARPLAVEGLDGKALALTFDFNGHGGYASVRRKRALELPQNYEISFDLRGDAPPNDFQLKLVDASGDNVWWFRRANFDFPKEWRHIRVKKRQIEFAWGPTQSRELRRAEGLELVVAAGKGGGRGTIAIDNLRIVPLPLPPATPPPLRARASSSAAGAGAALAVDGRSQTAWRSVPGVEKQELEIDLGYLREFGGLILRWQSGAAATRYDVELSDDAAHWQRVRSVAAGDGDRDALRLPESEARFVRLRLFDGPGQSYALAEVEVKDVAFGATPNAFVTAIAKESPRGRYPRAFAGEQTYWTLIAVDGAEDSGLISEDGALELGKGGVSIEPFVVSSSGVTSWADVTIRHSLKDGYLPLPSVVWHHRDWELEVSPFASGTPKRLELASRYELRNLTDTPVELRLVLAVRPFQVNPPTQSLNLPGGVSPIRSLGWDGAALVVNGKPAVFPVTPPNHVGLHSFDGGGFPERPPQPGGVAPMKLEDETGLASATLVYDSTVPPHARVALALIAPLGGNISQRRTLPDVEREAERTAALWREKLNRVALRLPEDGRALADTLRSSLAHILMSREGPMLRPGTRSYARSWIRDGAMMSESLLRLGHSVVAAEYLDWYSPHQFENGKVPCCVDGRGADPVPENDSPGELVFLAAQVFRFTGDQAQRERTWPAVEAATRYLETLRQSERTEKNRTPERRAFFGLLPPSISHEGYSDKAAYSYWDDFWGLIGYQDATFLAEARRDAVALERISRQRDEFRADLYASLRESAALHRIDHIPGAADRGDFDPTSTTIALAPGREGADLPQNLLRSTFERYYTEFSSRRNSTSWDVYTPYELRVVGTFVRLGWRERAHTLLDFFMHDRRPAEWNQWAEVVGREARTPRFIGDMPHAWIASDYVRSVLDLFVYERHADRSLVLAAGVPRAWWDQGGVELRDLRTPYGPVSLSITREGERVIVKVSGSAPPGGFALPWPWEGPEGRARVNGKTATWVGRELRFRELPARISLERPLQ